MAGGVARQGARRGRWGRGVVRPWCVGACRAMVGAWRGDGRGMAVGAWRGVGRGVAGGCGIGGRGVPMGAWRDGGVVCRGRGVAASEPAK